jgi:hypothetical protein
MRVKTLIEKILVLLCVYEIYMFYTTKTWDNGLVFKIRTSERLRTEYEKVKKLIEKTLK